MVSLSKAARKDVNVLTEIQVAMNGVLMQLHTIPATARPYIMAHPCGYVIIAHTPSFRATLDLLQVCLHCPSTFVCKVSRILRNTQLGRHEVTSNERITPLQLRLNYEGN